MRASLLHPLREPRHTRRRRRAHDRHADQAVAAETVAETVAEPAPAVAPAAESAPRPARRCDPDAQRVREAGGPVDHASYACSCGYLFIASVSTSVACPHCGACQAW
jgi:hypothetical protein